MRNAATTLNFSKLRKRTHSVGTHLLRVGERLGVLPPRTDYGRGYEMFMRLVPDAWDADDLYEFHWLMQYHGQRACTHAAPACSRCALRDLCSRCCSGGLDSRRTPETNARYLPKIADVRLVAGTCNHLYRTVVRWPDARSDGA
jgi:hypothetical protein